MIPVIQTTKDTRAERVVSVGLDEDVKGGRFPGGQFPAAHVAAPFIRKVNKHNPELIKDSGQFSVSKKTR